MAIDFDRFSTVCWSVGQFMFLKEEQNKKKLREFRQRVCGFRFELMGTWGVIILDQVHQLVDF